MFKSLFRSLAVILVTTVTALAAIEPAVAEDKVRTSNVSDHNLALKGYDAVAYFDQGEPTPGKSQFTFTYNGNVYRFATATNRDKFIKSPATYEPQYGGFCAFGASVGLKLEVDPEAFEIVDNKLYLNNTHDIHKMWLENTKGRIKVGNQHWKKIRGIAASKLTPIGFDG